mmetsp:Transcript_28786/g.59007  ORF Transcript_28786/g.59007 Transcript_28786/m.59007 type:complete len:385 (+) Transcript_28786:152-1306(+)|eukprot:CAMPEP_0181316864 /NCGR_PEP_ID=MMETSP1101-20121128/16123_1 /TAXON_ID=46948 /ORGANISM="Rhodomonas abbreviata, Strain Caron Lab Isolate" /LENGTH=384 /DNA_ID=CAMNT_0023424141 /DNA_START=134 /DNA_END=1288 /DNA_ORIENTATION=-
MAPTALATPPRSPKRGPDPVVKESPSRARALADRAVELYLSEIKTRVPMRFHDTVDSLETRVADASKPLLTRVDDSTESLVSLASQKLAAAKSTQDKVLIALLEKLFDLDEVLSGTRAEIDADAETDAAALATATRQMLVRQYENVASGLLADRILTMAESKVGKAEPFKGRAPRVVAVGKAAVDLGVTKARTEIVSYVAKKQDDTSAYVEGKKQLVRERVVAAVDRVKASELGALYVTLSDKYQPYLDKLKTESENGKELVVKTYDDAKQRALVFKLNVETRVLEMREFAVSKFNELAASENVVKLQELAKALKESSEARVREIGALLEKRADELKERDEAKRVVALVEEVKAREDVQAGLAKAAELVELVKAKLGLAQAQPE